MEATGEGLLQKYHKSFLNPTVCRRRRVGFIARQLEHCSLKGDVSTLQGITWSSLEREVESDICILRYQASAPQLWDPDLQRRLRHWIASGGIASLGGHYVQGAATPRRKPDTGTAQPGLVASGAVEGATLAQLSGCGRGNAKRFALRAWAYCFPDPETAAAHLAWHPIFGSTAPNIRAVAAAGRTCKACRAGVGQCKAGAKGCWRVLVAVLWPGPPGTVPPMGGSLPHGLGPSLAHERLHNAALELAAGKLFQSDGDSNAPVQSLTELLDSLLEATSKTTGLPPSQIMSLPGVDALWSRVLGESAPTKNEEQGSVSSYQCQPEQHLEVQQLADQNRIEAARSEAHIEACIEKPRTHTFGMQGDIEKHRDHTIGMQGEIEKHRTHTFGMQGEIENDEIVRIGNTSANSIPNFRHEKLETNTEGSNCHETNLALLGCQEQREYLFVRKGSNEPRKAIDSEETMREAHGVPVDSCLPIAAANSGNINNATEFSKTPQPDSDDRVRASLESLSNCDLPANLHNGIPPCASANELPLISSVPIPYGPYRWAMEMAQGVSAEALANNGDGVPVKLQLDSQLSKLNVEVPGEDRDIELCDVETVLTGEKARNALSGRLQCEPPADLCVLRLKDGNCLALVFKGQLGHMDFARHFAGICGCTLEVNCSEQGNQTERSKPATAMETIRNAVDAAKMIQCSTSATSVTTSATWLPHGVMAPIAIQEQPHAAGLLGSKPSSIGNAAKASASPEGVRRAVSSPAEPTTSQIASARASTVVYPQSIATPLGRPCNHVTSVGVASSSIAKTTTPSVSTPMLGIISDIVSPHQSTANLPLAAPIRMSSAVSSGSQSRPVSSPDSRALGFSHRVLAHCTKPQVIQPAQVISSPRAPPRSPTLAYRSRSSSPMGARCDLYAKPFESRSSSPIDASCSPSAPPYAFSATNAGMQRTRSASPGIVPGDHVPNLRPRTPRAQRPVHPISPHAAQATYPQCIMPAPAVAHSASAQAVMPLFSPRFITFPATNATSSPTLAARVMAPLPGPARIPSPGPAIGLTPPQLVAGSQQMVSAPARISRVPQRHSTPIRQSASPRSACGVQTELVAQPGADPSKQNALWQALTFCGRNTKRRETAGSRSSWSSQDSGAQEDDTSNLPSLVHL